MKSLSAAFKVGFLVIAVAILGYIMFRSVSEQVSGGQGYRLFGRFHDASGLVDKSRVVIAGLTIGEIVDKRLDGKLARVTVRVRGDTEIYANAVIAKKSSSLLGEFYLEIDPGSPEGVDRQGRIVTFERLKDGDEIKVVLEATSTQDIINQVGRILPRFEEVAEEVRDLAADARKLVNGPIANIAGNLDRAVEEDAKLVNSFLVKADDIATEVRDAVADGSPKRIMGNVEKASRELNTLLTSARNEVELTGADIRQRVQRLDKSLASLEETMGNAASISRKIDQPDQGTLGKLVNDPTIAENVEQVTEDVKGFTQSLFGLQTIVGLRAEYAFVGAISRGYFSVEVWTRPDKFYLFELAVDGRGDVKTTYTVDANSNLVRYQTFDIPGLRFTAQYGRKFGWLSLRAGLKDSTAGVGADAELLGERAKLSADLYQFTFDKFPRLRINLAWRLWRYLYLIGGVDDILNNPETRSISGNDVSGDLARRYYFGPDVYFGAQIRFNDEDLRSLLFALGGTVGAVAAK
ncbi:MAG TPA: MlaD family protein [Haliangiales bacterium]|nr:MlaD family protein [Haliangiales bacterium]